MNHGNAQPWNLLNIQLINVGMIFTRPGLLNTEYRIQNEKKKIERSCLLVTSVVSLPVPLQVAFPCSGETTALHRSILRSHSASLSHCCFSQPAATIGRSNAVRPSPSFDSTSARPYLWSRSPRGLGTPAATTTTTTTTTTSSYSVIRVLYSSIFDIYLLFVAGGCV